MTDNTTATAFENWENTVTEQPYPVAYRLENISQLLPQATLSYFQNDVAYLLAKAAAVPEAPYQMDTLVLNSTAIAVHWNKPIDNSGLIEEYVIFGRNIFHAINFIILTF